MQNLSGNSCLYWVFICVNFMLFLVGMGTTLAGTYVAAHLNSADWYSISFISIGFLIVIVSVWGFKMRYSMSSLTFYLIFAGFFLVAHLAFTLAIIFYDTFADKLGTYDADVIRYCMLAACGIIALSLFTGWWYRDSLQTKRFYYENYEMMKEPEAEQTKTSKDRQEMLKKYPQLRELQFKE
mmetsp:Transcript_19810/g.36574  ORF Transcript_19810/g.36574 Transcript_19810/m.36574 type:complete len:182 (-) Transcript_19810:2699-3244(-)